MSDDLVTFLRARLDEDEATAMACKFSRWKYAYGVLSGDAGPTAPIPWSMVNADGVQRHGEMEGRTWSDFAKRITIHDPEGAGLTHAARHDPARVLAEVAAKRRILDIHAPIAGACTTCCAEAIMDVHWDGEEETVVWTRHDMAAPCPTLRALGLLYADRPNYREEWRPSAE